MSNSLKTIPTELLELIITSVSRPNLKDVAPLLRVCRKWHDLSLPLVWQDVVLTKSNISSFSATISKHTHLAPRLRSLTLDVRLSYDEYSLTYKVAEYIKRLTQVLHLMHNLRTFSFQHHVDQSSPYPASAMTNDLILGLVSALPPCVQNLEIDSAVMYFTQHTGSQCLCNTLSQLLPHLHSLRLAYPRICAKLLDRPSETLQYLAINGIMQYFRPGLRGCDIAGEQARLSWDALLEQRITISIATVRDFLRTVQEKVLSSSSFFPRLKCLVVLEPYYFVQGTAWDHYLTNVYTVTPTDNSPGRIVARCFPTWTNDHFQYIIMRQCAHPPKLPLSPGTKKPLPLPPGHNCSHQDVAGLFEELRTMLEGSAGWVTTANNARRPQSHSQSLQTSLHTEELSSHSKDWDAHHHHQQQHQYQLFSRQAYHNQIGSPSSNSTATTYTSFRCLEGMARESRSSLLDLVHRGGLFARYAAHSHNTNNSDNNNGNYNTWDATFAERLLSNKVWRAEAEAKQTLLCGRVYDGNDGVPLNLAPEDFEI